MTEIETAQSLSDLLRGTVPDGAGKSKPPKKSETDTVRVAVPKYIPKTDTLYLSDVGLDPADISMTKLNLQAELSAIPHGFLLLPIKSGNPTISINSDRTLLDAIDPRDGSNLKIRYNHPVDRFDFGPFVDGGYTFNPNVHTHIKSGGFLEFRNKYLVRFGGNFIVEKKSVYPYLGFALSHDLTQYW